MEAVNSTNSCYDRISEVRKFDESKTGVKGLSDSGITSIPKFFIHSPQTLSDIKNTKSSDQTSISIPVLDLSDTNRNKLINQVKEAASTWGFFQVINHGISNSVLDSTIKAYKAFHEQPDDVKARHYKREEHCGVMYATNNDLYRSEAASWHDQLQAWMAPNELNPEELPEVCRKEVIEWDKCATRVAEAVMELLSEGLGLEAGKFKELTFSEARSLVGIYYPYCPQPDLTLGLTPHTDPGIVTVLLQNEIEGLQVKHQEHGWIAVKPVPGGLIVNIGDFLQIVSNGEYKSVQHRVVANSSKQPRISVVEFFNLRKWNESGGYGPLPELVSKEKPAIYRHFTQQEFLENFYSKGLDSKSIIERIEL